MPVCRICVSGPGERISFRCPESREDYVLSVVEYKKERLSENTFCPSGYAQFPTQFYQMKYTITPDIPADRVRISDCSGGDSPVRKEAGSVSKFAGAAAVGIIGGADGPCVAAVEDDERVKIRTAVSSLYYELPEKTEWAVTVYRKQYEDFNLTLI